jgi:hypothetical protein
MNLEHDPEKCEAVFRKEHAQTKRKIERDDDSKKNHHALGKTFSGFGIIRNTRAVASEWRLRVMNGT